MPPETENISIGESLNATIDAMEQPADPTPAPAPVAADLTPEPTVKEDRGDGRSVKGKFVKKGGTDDTPAHVGRPDKVDPKAEPESTTAQAPTTEGTPAPTTTTPAPAADAAPPAWKDGLKEKWATLDPAVKAEIARREREIGLGLQRSAEARKFGDSITQEFAPYAEVLSKENTTPQQAVRALLENAYTLRYGSQEHKHALFMSMAQQYGIDLNHEADPETARLQQELDNRKHDEFRNNAARQEHLQRSVAEELENFATAPGNEHYETVKGIMSGLLRSGTAKNLQEAYAHACWAEPTVRASIQLAENAKRVAEQAKNRNALASVNGAPGAVASGGKSTGREAENMRSFIEAQFEGTSGRV